MRALFLSFVLLSFLLSQDKKEINFQLQNQQNLEWWSKYNNNGIDFKKSFVSTYFKKKFNSTSLTIKAYFSESEILLGESFIGINTKYGRIQVGKYYRNFSYYLNDNLSSGSMLIGVNAPPVPKIGFDGSYKLKKRNDLIFRYGSSNGIFEKNEVYKEAPYYHDKFIYLSQIKKNNEFGVGFVHTAMWGGYSNNYGQFPIGFDSFLKVLVSADGVKKDNQPHANALGNHLGIWDFYWIFEREQKSLKFYYQHIFEDTSGLRFANKADGLWGVELLNRKNKVSFILEYINTINQDSNPPYVNESYYNHSEYSLGWSYKGYVLGNPFINNLTPNPSKVIYLALAAKEVNSFRIKIITSKQINTGGDLNYSFSFGKKYENYVLSFFVNGNKKNNLGLKIAYEL